MKNYSKKPQEKRPIDEFVEKVVPQVEKQEKPKKSNTGTVKCPLNVRQEPSLISSIIKVLPQGEKVVIETEQNGFGFIGCGWVKLEFIAR